MWFHKARTAWTAQRGAGWPCGLFARASLCGCALAAAARARALALSGLVALRSRRLVPFRHGDNRCAAEFSLPRAMMLNVDVVIKTGGENRCMQFSLASAALITRIVSRAGRGPWSQTGDKHGAAHVHVGCTVGICGRTQRLQAWARVQLRRDWLRMGPRSYRRRHRCHHRRTATGRSPPPSPPPAGVASSARLLAGRAARCLAHRRGHHLGAALSPPLAANGVAVVCGCQMALRACAAAKWRCAVCGCRMALRGVRLPNVAAGV